MNSLKLNIFITDEFRKEIKKVKDKTVQERIKKILSKISDNPSVGKPLRYTMKGLRSLRIPPFRLIYKIETDRIILISFKHRKEVYK